MTTQHSAVEVSRNIANLLARYIRTRGMTVTSTAKAIGIDQRDLAVRVRPIDESTASAAKELHQWKLWQLLRAVDVLEIPEEEVAEAIFPSLPTRMPSLPRLERRIRELEDENAELREGRYEPQTAAGELLRTGRWAVSALPVVEPLDDGDHAVVTSVNLSVAPLGPGTEGLSVQDVRQRLATDVPAIYRRATVMSGAASRLPTLPGPRRSPASVALNLSIPVFSEDRDAAPRASRAHFHYQGEGVLVIGSTITAGSRLIAAIIARALGWELVGTRTRARTLRPQIDDWSGVNHRAWMRDESQRQLSAILFEDNAYRVISHSGYPGPDSVTHPLIAAVEHHLAREAKLPYVVLLREDDAVLESAAGRGVQEDPDRPADDSRNVVFLERLIANRDALWDCVSRLPADRQTILSIRDVEARPGDADWNRQHLMRSAAHSREVLNRLTGNADALRILDRDAAALLQAVSRSSDSTPRPAQERSTN